VKRPTRLLRGLLAALCLASAAHAGITVQDDRGRQIEMPAPPQRIVSLLPSLTESVCALRACARLVGVDRFSNWPHSVRKLPQLGGLEDTQIERLVALKPDVVLVAESSRAIDRLEALGLRVVVLQPKNLQDTGAPAGRRTGRACAVAGHADPGGRRRHACAQAAARAEGVFRSGIGTLCRR